MEKQKFNYCRKPSVFCFLNILGCFGVFEVVFSVQNFTINLSFGFKYGDVVEFSSLNRVILIKV